MLSFHLTGGLAAGEGREGDNNSKGLPRRQLTLILDELAAVGRLDLIARQIAYLRGYGIQVVAAVQTVSLLYEIYGRNESFRGNVAYLIVFPSTEQRTAEEISRLLGDRTLYVATQGRSSGATWLASRRSTSTRDQKRPLLTADEVRRLPNKRPMLLVTGAHPVACHLGGFFRTKSLADRTRTRRSCAATRLSSSALVDLPVVDAVPDEVPSASQAGAQNQASDLAHPTAGRPSKLF